MRQSLALSEDPRQLFRSLVPNAVGAQVKVNQSLALTKHPRQPSLGLSAALESHCQTFRQATKVPQNATLVQCSASLLHENDAGTMLNQTFSELFAYPQSRNDPLSRPNEAQQSWGECQELVLAIFQGHAGAARRRHAHDPTILSLERCTNSSFPPRQRSLLKGERSGDVCVGACVARTGSKAGPHSGRIFEHCHSGAIEEYRGSPCTGRRTHSEALTPLEFVQSGCIDGEASTVEALYESCSDFLQECDVSADGFKQAVHRLSSGKENSAAVSEENNAAHQNEASAAGASAKAEKENGSRRSEGHSTSSTGNSANAGGGRAPQQQKSGGKRADGSGEDKKEKPGASTQHADHQKTEAGAAISKSEKRKGMQKEASTASGTVLALFKAAALPEADPTILEYIQTVAEDFVATGSKDEEEEEEVRETILGVAPELASFLAEEKNFAFFLGRIRTLSQQKSAEERKQDHPCAQKKRVTEEEEQNAEERLREEEEERKRAEQAAAKRREEEWLKG
eukprot:834975-Rhodomonas_salina.2